MKNILCFGDSNTYGYRPDGSGRYDEETRWTARLQKILGNEEYHIIEEGLCGRTTVFEDALRSARKGIDAIEMLVETHSPLDIVIVMLGTNDCKTRYGASGAVIAKGVEAIIEKIRNYGDIKILVISPILLKEGVGEAGFDPEFDKHSEQTSRQLAGEIKKVAQKNNCVFLDAASVAEASSTDREHLDEKGHAELAVAVAEKVTEIYEKELI